MYDIEKFINKSIDDILVIFKEYNQLTTVYLVQDNINTILYTFGTNEGGPSYNIYVDSDGIVTHINQTDIHIC